MKGNKLTEMDELNYRLRIQVAGRIKAEAEADLLRAERDEARAYLEELRSAIVSIPETVAGRPFPAEIVRVCDEARAEISRLEALVRAGEQRWVEQ